MPENIKRVMYVFDGSYAYDGAGVKLRRIFGGQDTAAMTDPFLLMDHFGSDNMDDYIRGFPWHPHRGIETVTYQFRGKTNHEDSEGHRGTIYPGEIQWMTAGSGIFHEEMPKPAEFEDGKPASSVLDATNSGMQIWINMPSSLKMSDPSYRSIKKSIIPFVEDEFGNRIGIVSGRFMKVDGALNSDFDYSLSSFIDPYYLDVQIEEDSEFRTDFPEGYTVIVYVIEGEAVYRETVMRAGSGYVLSRDGKGIIIKSSTRSRILVLAGKPLGEPVAWYGPIVMNTREEISGALRELNDGRFIRNRNPAWQ